MTSINSVTLIGYSAKEAELRSFESGSKKTTFSLAVKPPYKTDDESPLWFECEAWGNLAVLCKKFITKGKQIAIEGSYKQERWQDTNSGNLRCKPVILVKNMTLLGKKDADDNTNDTENY